LLVCLCLFPLKNELEKGEYIEGAYA
jgi:hypothetical protein